MISLLLAVVMLACLIPPVSMTAQASVTGYDIVAFARQYLGYPYKMGTSGPNSFDCAGFVSYVFKNFGIDLPKNASAYFNDPTKYGTLIDKGSIEKAQMGDVIAWAGHVAIYTEDERCVEALGTGYGVCDWVKVDRHTNGKNYKVIRIKGVLPEGTPIISSLSASNSGVEIKWGTVANSGNYRVFRKAANGNWVMLADTPATSYVDKTAVSGKTYTYTIRCVSKDGKTYTSDYDKDGKSINFLVPPKISSVTNIDKGVNISWGSVAGAAKYRVFCKTSSSDWAWIADTASTNYTWTGAKSGTNYTFTVRCLSSAGNAYMSGYDVVGKSMKYVAAPAISSVSNTLSGVQITWGAVAGAEKYRVFYRIGTGAWTKITDTTATSYTWTGPVNNTNYTFTVRCINSSGTVYTSSFDTAGKTIKYLSAPKITSISTLSAAIQIDWGKVTGAEKYRVFYKTPSSDWTWIADTTSTSYTWLGAKGGTNYTFTVRCLNSAGNAYTSGYDTVGKSISYLATPKLTSVSAANNGAVISWEKVPNAELYRVFYKTASGGWTKLSDTTSTSYTWTGAKIGTTYAFTVRCVTKDGKTYTSGYDNTGKSFKQIANPVLSSLEPTSTGINISWGSVSGAEKYRIFYKTSSSDWIWVADTTSTSYNWKGAKSGTNYAFTVRCLNSAGNAYTSGYDTVGRSIEYIAAPKLTSVQAVNSGIQIDWGKVTGASKYRVFYKNSSGGWTKITDTTSTSYTWTDAKIGTKYIFTVRCLSSDGAKYTSWFDSAGLGITYVSAPKISSVTSNTSGITINWGSVSGAEKYRVFYKTGSSDWLWIADTTSTSCTWTGAKNGTTYSFTVRCVTKDGKSYAGGYDSKGISIMYK